MYLHDIDPFALQITETFGIRWYGLAYLAGFLCGYLLIRWMARKQLSSLPVSLAGDFVFSVALGTIIGGRLGYCIFYRPELLIEFTSEVPFWGVLAVHKGGMASHGGMLGIVLTCIWYGRKHQLTSQHLIDLTTLGGAIGIFFGRIANFINGELVGRVASSAALWPVKFPQDILLWPGYEPQRLSTLSEVVTKIGFSAEEWTRLLLRGPYSIQVERILQKIIEHVQQGDSSVVTALAPLLDPRHPSQLYAALLEGILVLLLLLWSWRKPRIPGVITAQFFALYSFGRILVEQFRAPDAHLGYQMLGLTRGQWLSVGLLVFAGLIYWWAKRSKLAPTGGWSKRYRESRASLETR